MARPKKTDTPDLSEAQDLTAGLIERLSCPAGKLQTFMRDAKAPGLRVRVTAAGAKSFVFEAKLNRQTIRRTIGDVRAWSIEAARNEANRLRVTLDGGFDPREIEREQHRAKAALKLEVAANEMTVGEAWRRYVEERRQHWSPLHLRDHEKLSQLGGETRTRLAGVVTKPGPLATLLPLRLTELDPEVIEDWAAQEAKERPARVRLALRLLKAFMRWAATQRDLKGKADPDAASSKKAREFAGKPERKDGSLQREQLPAWFENVCHISNPVTSAYLQCLLITGRRREHVAELKWEDVDFQWLSMTMKDKVEKRATIPLTPYLAFLLARLPRRNAFVFSSVGSVSGKLMDPNIAHSKACKAAGLELSLHDLRRSFASLCEWLDIPGGISAQISGHAPQGVREQNYIRRPLDLLRVHHEKIEAWILEQAGIVFDAKAAPGRLRSVS